MAENLTGADLLLRRLREHGVRHLFGYPGGQLTPLYDALYRQSDIRHILARDEQAAAFMADGYARASGRPGVCLAVCGPGVYNAATPLASAFTDSIPVLLISGQVATSGRGLRSGYYHENEQTHAAISLTKDIGSIDHPREIIPEVDDAFFAMTTGRPGPALLDFPVNIQRAEMRLHGSSGGETALEVPLDADATEFRVETFPALAEAPPAAPDPREVQALASLLASWQRPLLLAGGGVTSANAEAELTQLADRLGAPVFHTFMGKCAISARHPLKAGLPWRWSTSDLTNMDAAFSPLFAQADGLLAVGCRFTQAATGSWTLKPPASIAQIDVDAEEIGRHYPVQAGVVGDARLTLQALFQSLPNEKRTPWSVPQPPANDPFPLPGLSLAAPLRRLLPDDAIVVADITRLSYILLAKFPVYQPRTFLHPAGFVPMGYGIPAALGARAAFPDRPIVAVVGDGCFLMSGMELASAVQEDLPIIIVLVNDNCLTLIKAIQERKYDQRFMGVDLRNPDFGMLTRSFGVRHWRADSDATFENALQEGLSARETSLIEVAIRR